MTGLEYIYNRTLHPFWDHSRDPNKEDVADAFEQGKAEGIKELKEKAWKEADLAQWYISSVDAHLPIWTEEHIVELCKDFILIKRNS